MFQNIMQVLAQEFWNYQCLGPLWPFLTDTLVAMLGATVRSLKRYNILLKMLRISVFSPVCTGERITQHFLNRFIDMLFSFS
jgi:hypothetical protein